MENPIKIDDLGVPLFSETPISCSSVASLLSTLPPGSAAATHPFRVSGSRPAVIHCHSFPPFLLPLQVERWNRQAELAQVTEKCTYRHTLLWWCLTFSVAASQLCGMNLDNMILQAFQSEGFGKSTPPVQNSKHSWCLLTGLLLLSIQVVDLASSHGVRDAAMFIWAVW